MKGVTDNFSGQASRGLFRRLNNWLYALNVRKKTRMTLRLHIYKIKYYLLTMLHVRSWPRLLINERQVHGLHPA